MSVPTLASPARTSRAERQTAQSVLQGPSSLWHSSWSDCRHIEAQLHCAAAASSAAKSWRRFNKAAGRHRVPSVPQCIAAVVMVGRLNFARLTQDHLRVCGVRLRVQSSNQNTVEAGPQ